LLARKGTTDRVNLSLPDKNQQVRANMSHLTIDTENNQRQPFELPGAKPHYNPDRPGQVNHIFRKRSGGLKKKKDKPFPSSHKIRQLSKSHLHQNK
jgi:hypothetical protein